MVIGVIWLILYEVCIYLRPGKPLPPSQEPKRDRRYPSSKILNDVENGIDVSDEEIAMVFPTRRHRETQEVTFPGGLPAAYQEKLTKIREKKEQSLKATPPEKK